MVSQCVVAGKLACSFIRWSFQVSTTLRFLHSRVALYIIKYLDQISFHGHKNLIEDAKINKLLDSKRKFVSVR